jgi:hypothetical protein
MFNRLELANIKQQSNSSTSLRLSEMKKQIESNKLFLNMVVHDMRSPTVSIKLGLDRTKDELDQILLIIKELE